MWRSGALFSEDAEAEERENRKLLEAGRFVNRIPQDSFRLGATAEAALKKVATDMSFWESFFGSVTFRTSSWAQLAKTAKQRKGELLALLEETVDPDAKCDVQLVDVQVVAIGGQKGNWCGDSWLTVAGLLAKFEICYDHLGYSIETGGRSRQTYRNPCGGLPTLSSLGMQEMVDEQLFEGTENSNGYLLRMKENYTVRKWHGYDELGWMADLLMLRICLGPFTRQVLQVSLADGESGAEGPNGLMWVHVTNLGGENMVSIELDIWQETGMQLLMAVSKKSGIKLRNLCLTFASGQFVSMANGDRYATLSKLLQANRTSQSADA